MVHTFEQGMFLRHYDGLCYEHSLLRCGERGKVRARRADDESHSDGIPLVPGHTVPRHHDCSLLQTSGQVCHHTVCLDYLHKSGRSVYISGPSLLQIQKANLRICWLVCKTLPLRPTCANVALTQRRYVTSVAEAAVLLVISYFFNDLMKFDDTNIVERMGALTLIIIGEGIIGMTEKVSFILQTSSNISASSAGMIVSAVLVIYVLWMLYFDHTDMLDRPGSRINKTKPWGQLWAFLHFPLHTVILITVEGSARFISWWNANEALNFLLSSFDTDWDYPPYVQNGTQLAQGVQLQLKNITGAYPYLVEVINGTDFQANLTKIQNLGTFVGLSESTYNDTYNNLSDLLYYMNDALYVKTCDLFDIDIPEAQEDPDAIIDLIYKAYTDWFIAFFVAAGCVLIVLALARYVGHQGASSKSGPLLEPDRRDKKR